MNALALSVTLLLFLFPPLQNTTPAGSPEAAAPGLLQPQQVEETLPSTVFFQDKIAPTQARNSGGVRSADGKITEFALVDASGYSSAIRERYQFYLLTSVAIELGGKTFGPGAYGGGFLGGKALLMDLGGKDLAQVPLSSDSELKRPRPLQVMSTPGAGGPYRLYLGREFVSFRQLR